MDISKPAGAWHYATILCRLAVRHAKRLENEFIKVKFTGPIAAWTAAEQIAELDKAQTQQAQTLQARLRRKNQPEKAEDGHSTFITYSSLRDVFPILYA